MAGYFSEEDEEERREREEAEQEDPFGDDEIPQDDEELLDDEDEFDEEETDEEEGEAEVENQGGWLRNLFSVRVGMANGKELEEMAEREAKNRYGSKIKKMKDYKCPVCQQRTVYTEPIGETMVRVAASYIGSFVGMQVRKPKYICLNPRCKMYFTEHRKRLVLNDAGKLETSWKTNWLSMK